MQGLSCHSPVGLHAYATKCKRVPVPGTRAKLCTGHIKRHRFQVVASSEQPGSQPLRQEVVAVLGAAALVASSLSAAGPSFAQDSLLSTWSHGAASKAPLGLLFKPAGSDSDTKSEYTNFHQLKANDIDGKEVNFADLDGKVVLVVNVATY